MFPATPWAWTLHVCSWLAAFAHQAIRRLQRSGMANHLSLCCSAWGHLGTGCPLFAKGSLLAGYLEFYFAKQRGGLDPLSLNDQEKGTPPSPPPQRELSPYAWRVSSRSSPFAVSRHHHHHHHHQQHHHHHPPPPHHHHHSTWHSDFSTSVFQVPNGAMKVTGSSIHRYRKKRHWSLC